MASEKQIKANRENALRSTGPKTEAGKARSRLNAMKHGAYSTNHLTPDEKDEDIDRLKGMYMAYYKPQNDIQKSWVLSLAEHAWRLARYARMETEILTDHGLQPDWERGDNPYTYAGTGWAFSRDCELTKSVSILSQIEYRACRRYERLRKFLDEILLHRASPVNDDNVVAGKVSSGDKSTAA